MGRKFYRALKALATKLGCHPQDLLAVMYLESGCKPVAFNKLTSAVGLIQCLPSTLKAVGYQQGVYAFQTLSAWEQMPYVERYFMGIVKAYGNNLTTIDRLYRAVLYPISLTYGDDDMTAIFAAGSQAYQYNSGLDLDADGVVSVHDIRRKFEILTAQTAFDSLVGEMMFENVVWAPDVIAEVALRYVDVGNSLDTPRYLEVMAGVADGPSTVRYLLAGPSTCALFARGVWRIAGVESGILTAMPYRIGRAVSDIVEIAKEHDAWHPNPSHLEDIKKGDVLLVAPPEHVVVVISDPVIVDGNKVQFDTVEGGQSGPQGGSSYVKRFTRRLGLKDGKLWTAGKYGSWVHGRADACELLPPAPHST